MGLKANFELMAVYNQWMNDSIYTAAATLRSEDLSKDRGAFFGSILGTLNHILVGDTLWLKRFANHPANPAALAYLNEVPAPPSLDAILFPELAGLSAARKAMDDTIIRFSHELTDDMLATTLHYTNSKGLPFAKNFGQLIQHFFNHQTHHRGQVSTLLYQAGVDIGVTDLLMKIPNA